MTDKHDIDIYLSGYSEESEKIVSQLVGTMYNSEDKIHILYDERFEGDLELTRNHLTIDGDEIRLMKQGPVSAIMIFDQKTEHNTAYNTPNGSLPMTIRTTGIQVNELENGLDVLIDYTLDFGGGEPLKNQINLKARHKDDGFLIT